MTVKPWAEIKTKIDPKRRQEIKEEAQAEAKRLEDLKSKLDCCCAGPEYHPDKPCPRHPKTNR
jgi:hypothetical protein